MAYICFAVGVFRLASPVAMLLTYFNRKKCTLAVSSQRSCDLSLPEGVVCLAGKGNYRRLEQKWFRFSQVVIGVRYSGAFATSAEEFVCLSLASRPESVLCAAYEAGSKKQK